MEFNLLDVVQHVLNIVVLYIILRAVLYNPVRKFMNARDEKQQQQKLQTEQALAAAQAAAAENEQKLAEIQRETQALAAEKKAYAEKAAAETLAEARAEAARLLEQARAEILAERQKAQEDFVNQSAEIAVELARQILGREVSREDNQRLIDDFFKKVG